MKTTFQSVAALLLAGGASLVLGAHSLPAQSTVSLRAIKYVAPEFPEIARQEGVAEGKAVVMFSHDAAGRVNDAVALESTHPAFAREAVDAVRQWKLAPHGEGGVCQCAHVIPFSFRASGLIFLDGHAAAAARSRTSGAAATPEALVSRFDDLETKPRLLASVLPALPAEARSALKSGLVRVTFLVDEKGRIRVPSILSAPDPAVGAAVLTALAQWRYAAPQKNGRAVVAMTELSFDFGDNKALAAVAATQVHAAADRR